MFYYSGHQSSQVIASDLKSGCRNGTVAGLHISCCDSNKNRLGSKTVVPVTATRRPAAPSNTYKRKFEGMWMVHVISIRVKLALSPPISPIPRTCVSIFSEI